MGDEGLAIAAAVATPLSTTFGLVAWEMHWHPTFDPWVNALGLNLFKCTLASAVNVPLVSALPEGWEPLLKVGRLNLGMLLVSSLIGIVIGDTMWLYALHVLGAQSVIVITALGPIFHSLAGVLILGQRTNPSLLWPGAVLTCAGICIAESRRVSVSAVMRRIRGRGGEELEMSTAVVAGAAEGAAEGDGSSAGTASQRAHWRRILFGYAMQMMNTLLDVGGTVLTRLYGEGLNAAHITLVRFGSAAVAIGAIALFVGVRRRAANKPPLHLDSEMRRQSWAWCAIGVLLVTFLAPNMSTWALFVLKHLGTWGSLTALGPIFTPFSQWCMARCAQRGESRGAAADERLCACDAGNARYYVGALLAICGAVLVSWADYDSA